MEQSSTLIGGAIFLGHAHRPVLMNAEDWTSALRVVRDAELRVGSVGCRVKVVSKKASANGKLIWRQARRLQAHQASCEE
eukprot:3614551-Heterocapsa_arctica.AAC.1